MQYLEIREGILVESPNPNLLQFPLTNDIRLESAIKAFDSGDGSKKLLDEFIYLVNEGFAEASYFLGCIYEDGTDEVPKNFENAFFYYQQSAEEIGYLEGVLALGKMYYHGMGTQQNYQNAFKYYKIVFNKNAHPVASFMLGRMYQYGTGVDKNVELARYHYNLAVASGNVYGLINLSLLEAQEGNKFKSIWLRYLAGLRTFLIAKNNPKDVRLRGS